MAERVFPPIETDAAPVIAELVSGAIVRSELVGGGLTNTLRRIELADGRVLGVKQYVLGRSFATEGAALRVLARVIPVPRIVYTLDRVIAYRWIDGITLNECRRRDRSAFARLAEPLGELLGTLARITRPAKPIDLAPALAQLGSGRAQARLGGELAEGLRQLLEAERFDDPACFAHGDFGGRNVIVAPGLDRIAGVIDWEAAGAGSMLRDAGSLFRYVSRYDAAFVAAFARGHGALPDGWLRRARLLDTTRLVATLAEDRELPEVHGDLRALIADVVAAG